ncbi:MAG: sigma 54-interacting transcriptional regulator [Myxococcota bacterium]
MSTSDDSEASTNILVAVGKQATRVRRATLEVTAGPDVGKKVQTLAERLTVGTLPANDLVLTDRAVSRFHAELIRQGDEVRVRDLGSTNGTFVANVRVLDALLGRSATLRVGETTLRLGLGESSEVVPLHPEPRFGKLVGQSVVMRALFAQLARLAPLDVTVLLEGETGTGKELVADALHRHSHRRERPFIVVDCGSIPSELVESELFGHERGSFTGASGDRRGAFESADGGTLFLDEIGELPLAVQPKLLRALEARKVKRVGSDSFRSVNVRVIAATHRDLRAAVNHGHFREDLYYRLAVAPVRLPPLRERLEDLPLLLRQMWKETLEQLGLPPRELPLTREALAELSSLPWEGNVRELRNFVERSAALSGQLDPAALGVRASATSSQLDVRVDLPYKEARALWVEHFERVYLSHYLEKTSGNVAQAAREAGMDRAYLIKLLRKRDDSGGES